MTGDNGRAATPGGEGGGDGADGREIAGRDRLAAEHALRLLEGEEALEARALAAHDSGFAADVAYWEARFAPLLDELEPGEPSDALWSRIETSLSHEARDNRSNGGANDNDSRLVLLERKVRRWRWVSAGSVAAAAVAIALLAGPLVGPTAQRGAPPAGAAQDPLVASIPIGETALRLGVTYLPDRGEALVSAAGLEPDGIHDHELWLLDPDGDPVSLGVVVPGSQARVTVPGSLDERMRAGATLILTRERLGGAPAGGDAGPVVASGTLEPV